MEKKLEKKVEVMTILLWVILGVLVLNTCFVIFNKGTVEKPIDETEATDEYDVSSFNAINEEGFMAAIKKSDIQVIYFGRSTCGYCVQFLPTMKQAQEELKFTTQYVDITKVNTSSEDYTSMTTLINDQTEAFNKENGLKDNEAYKYLYGFTPMVVLAKDGKIVDVWVGYSSYETYKTWLTDNGVK